MPESYQDIRRSGTNAALKKVLILVNRRHKATQWSTSSASLRVNKLVWVELRRETPLHRGTTVARLVRDSHLYVLKFL